MLGWDAGKVEGAVVQDGGELFVIRKRGAEMRFARVVFWVAGIWGVVVITPLYFMLNLIGKQDPPTITHPGFYYGFVGCALAWQIAFLSPDSLRDAHLQRSSYLE